MIAALPTLTLARQPAGKTVRAHQATPVLRLAMPDASPTVDPALVADEQDVELANMLYAGLVRLNSSYKVVPGAAWRWTLSHNHRTYTFYLRRGMHFSNGDPLTAYSFAYSIRRSLNPSVKSPSAPTYLLDIEGAAPYLAGKAKSLTGVRVLDRYRMQITARWPVPYFLMELTYPTSFALDKNRLTKVGMTSTSWYGSPISSGPYELKSWDPNVGLQLVPNKRFWGKRARQDVSITLTGLPTNSLLQYVHSQLDVASLPDVESSYLKSSGMHDVTMLAINGIYMNMLHKPFDNVQVRRALTLSLDRPKLVKASLGDSASPFVGYVPPGEAGYDKHVKPLPSNPSAARKALVAAGYGSRKHLPALTLYYASDPGSPTTGQPIASLAGAVAASWRKNLHVKATARALTLNTLFAKVQANSLPLYLLGWSANYPDPHDWLSGQWRSDSVNNSVHFSNANFDKLVASADATWRWKRRNRLDDRAQQLLINQAAWIPLYIPHQLVYIRPSVADLAATGYGLIPRDGAWTRVSIKSTMGQPSKGS
ncbi:MAG: peptide ABC transporter substrate-binding protein [Chloroflexota bacterium]